MEIERGQSPAPDSKVPGFRVLRELGRGATAQVFHAVRESDGAQVALKILHPAFGESSEVRRRISAEVRATGKLSHPNIQRLLDDLSSSPTPAVALEFVDGVSLADFQARLPYVLPEVSALVMIEILDALAHAHKSGVIHRDLKPSNVLVSEKDARVAVADFGLAKISDVSNSTLTGAVLGSPDFMSPEQARGDVVNFQSDLFSAASIFYFLVTGTRPFSRDSALATLAAVNNAEFEPAQKRNPKLSPALAKIIHKGLSKKPADRFASAAEFRDVLKAHLHSVGIANDFSLALWMKEPGSVTMRALKTMSETLAGKASALLEAGSPDRALELLNHLSLIAPESQVLRDLLERFSVANTLEQEPVTAAKRAGIPLQTRLLVAIALLAVGVFVWKKNQPLVPSASVAQTASEAKASAPAPADPNPPALEPSSAPSRVVPAPPKAIEKKIPAPKPVAPKARPPKPSESETPVVSDAEQLGRARVSNRPVVEGNVEFHLPPDVRVSWDGVEVNPRQKLRATTGAHRLILQKKGFPPIAQTINVLPNEPTVIRVE